MPVEIIRVNNGKLLKEFIRLPLHLYKHYNQYVPPFYKDELIFHDPQKNKHLSKSETICLLASDNGTLKGRIMGIIPNENSLKNTKITARFFQFDSINDPPVSSALFESMEKWAMDRGASEIIGPFGFSDKDPQGLQTEGFDLPPVIASVSHPPYLNDLVTGLGYTKFKDCVSYQLPIPDGVSDFYRKIYTRILMNHQVKLLEFKSSRSLRPYFVPVMRLLNKNYNNIFGFVPMTEQEMTSLAKQFLPVLDPALVKIVVNQSSEPVAFVVAMRNLSRGIRMSHGRLLPWGFIPMLIEMNRSTQLDLLLGAVDKPYRGRGLNLLMGISLMETARKKGMKVLDSHLILEENRLMRAEMENLGGKISKRYRIYGKMLRS